ncbi:MAG TPA: MarR family winged helix-turn-helix transcriptional regulator, partial [bacterium]
MAKSEMTYYATVCASFNFRKAARAVTQLFDTALQPVGIRSTQLVVLLAAGIYEKPTMSEMADIMVTDRTTLTRALKPLFRKGLLVNVPGQDKRKSCVSLTDRGHQTIRKSVPYWHKAQNHFEKGF